jgi:phosphoribosylanthranilate isomerase
VDIQGLMYPSSMSLEAGTIALESVAGRTFDASRWERYRTFHDQWIHVVRHVGWMVKQKQQTCSLVVYNVNAKLLQQHQPARATRVHKARGPAYRRYIKNFKCRIEIYITKRTETSQVFRF